MADIPQWLPHQIRIGSGVQRESRQVGACHRRQGSCGIQVLDAPDSFRPHAGRGTRGGQLLQCFQCFLFALGRPANKFFTNAAYYDRVKILLDFFRQTEQVVAAHAQMLIVQSSGCQGLRGIGPAGRSLRRLAQGKAGSSPHKMRFATRRIERARQGSQRVTSFSVVSVGRIPSSQLSQFICIANSTGSGNRVGLSVTFAEQLTRNSHQRGRKRGLVILLYKLLSRTGAGGSDKGSRRAVPVR